jgi:hypothetical protein
MLATYYEFKKLALENPLPEDFGGNRLKLALRQCKAIAIEF